MTRSFKFNLQRDAFMGGEGDAWYHRNIEKLGLNDPVSPMFDQLGIFPESLLEIGCSNGWRLRKLQNKYACKVRGIDPSLEAIADNQIEQGGFIHHGVASNLSMFIDNAFDVVIFGFCLYVCDPIDYFKIATEADRVLNDGGYIIIHDFKWSGDNYKVEYKHLDSVWSYHYNFGRLWCASPCYRPVGATEGEDFSVLVLQKDINGAYDSFTSEGI